MSPSAAPSSPRIPGRRGGLSARIAFAAGLLAGGANAADRLGESARTAAAPPNLLLVTLDTTRADHLGAYGHPDAKTPRLDRLAADGVRFERCDTAAPITLPSHATLLTGLFPPRHRVRDNGTFALAPDVVTVAERLRDAGYDTAAVVAAIVLARRHGLDQGFRVYDDDLGTGYEIGTSVAERDAGAVTDAALALAATLRPPYFLWVHYYDPHEEYRPPTAFAAAATGVHRLYDGEIAYVDAELGRLLDGLGGSPATLVVGDHGEMLGEHGEASHGLLLFAGSRRVPLILSGAEIPRGVAVSELARTVDVAPTLLDLAHLPAPGGLDGASLLPLADRARRPTSAPLPPRLSYSESFLPFFAYRWYPLRALSDGRFLYLEAPRPALYSLDPPRPEQTDLAETERRRFHAFAAELERLVGAAGERLDGELRGERALSAEQVAALASLGYAAPGGGGAIHRALPDPRARVGVASRLHELASAARDGRCAEIVPELEALTREDPANFPALSFLGQCLRDQGHCDRALPVFERAARANEMSAAPVASVAGCLLDLGRAGEAEREYRHALALDPAQTESATNLARLLRKRGAGEEALALLDGAIAAGSLAASSYLERGTARAELGRLEPALADFREASRRDPRDRVAVENTARALYQLGRPAEAAIAYASLARLAPDRGDVAKTLGAIYLYDLARPIDAREQFRQALRLERDPVERERLVALLAELER